MPSRSGLDRCVRCNRKHAVVGAFTTYYVSHKKHDGPMSRKMTLIKVPARGLDRRKMDEVRQKLDSGTRTDGKKSRVRL